MYIYEPLKWNSKAEGLKTSKCMEKFRDKMARKIQVRDMKIMKIRRVYKDLKIYTVYQTPKHPKQDNNRSRNILLYAHIYQE